MKQFLAGALAALGVAAATGAIIIHSGAIDMAADAPHSPAAARLIEYLREQSVERRAGALSPPADLAAADRVRRGAGNYDAMCADCHLSPGKKNTEIRPGLYPTPPDLTRAPPASDPARAAARQFWIIKHGIKGSGMAAWSQGGMEDAALWDLVALLQQLPNLSPAQYQQLVAASEGHSHGGMRDHDRADSAHEHGEPAAAEHATHEHAGQPGHPHGHAQTSGHGDHAH